MRFIIFDAERITWDACCKRYVRADCVRTSYKGHFYWYEIVSPETNAERRRKKKGGRPRTGKRVYYCENEACEGKTFRDKFNLQTHLRVHVSVNPQTGEWPYKCQQCDKSFISPAHLKYHIDTHQPEKQFKCEHPGCGKQFSRKNRYENHLLVHVSIFTFRQGNVLLSANFSTVANLSEIEQPLRLTWKPILATSLICVRWKVVELLTKTKMG